MCARSKKMFEIYLENHIINFVAGVRASGILRWSEIGDFVQLALG